MGLLGLIVAMVGGLLLGAAGPFETAVAAVGVLLFTGLIAYDTQALRRAYDPAMTAGDRDRAALWGAVDLFLDAVNLFQFVLMLGGSKDD
jgi:FtsH-binding integral membrane protein